MARPKETWRDRVITAPAPVGGASCARLDSPSGRIASTVMAVLVLTGLVAEGYAARQLAVGSLAAEAFFCARTQATDGVSGCRYDP